MKLTLSSIKQSLLSKTGSRSLTNIANLYSIVQETIFAMMSRVSLPSAIRKVPLFAPLLESPNLYILPNDMSSEGVVDVYNRDYTNNYPSTTIGTTSLDFMRRAVSGIKTGLTSIEDIDGVQYLNIVDSSVPMSYIIDECEDSNNGTFTAIGTANALGYDSVNKWSGNSSLAFYVNTTSSPFGIEKANYVTEPTITGMTHMVMNVFIPVFLNNGFTVQYGDSATDYWKLTNTGKDWQGNRLRIGWNTVVFDLSVKAQIGVPVSTTNKYLSLQFTDVVTANITEPFRLDSVYFTTGYNYDLKYYSNSIIFNSYGSRKDNCLPTADTDYILLNNREYNLFLKQFSVLTSIDVHPDNGVSEYNAYSRSLEKAYEQFMMEYPSESLLQTSPY